MFKKPETELSSTLFSNAKIEAVIGYYTRLQKQIEAPSGVKDLNWSRDKLPLISKINRRLNELLKLNSALERLKDKDFTRSNQLFFSSNVNLKNSNDNPLLKRYETINKELAGLGVDLNKLFISSSGNAYKIDEIVLILRKGIFSDFKDRNPKIYLPLRLFTEEDVIALFNEEEIRETFIHAYGDFFQDLQETSNFISDKTLSIIKETAEKSKILDNQLIALNDDLLTDEFLPVISKLYERLHALKDNADDAEQIKNEVFLLERLTNSKGFLQGYYLGRGKDFVTDIDKIALKRSCESGFQREITNLYAVLQSHRLFTHAQVKLDTTESYAAEKDNIKTFTK